MRVGRVAPKERGEFFARVFFGMQNEVREQRFHFARVERKRLAARHQRRTEPRALLASADAGAHEQQALRRQRLVAVVALGQGRLGPAGVLGGAGEPGGIEAPPPPKKAEPT